MSHISLLASRLASVAACLHDVSRGDNPYPIQAYQRAVDLLPPSLESTLLRRNHETLFFIAFGAHDRYRPLVAQVQSCIATGINDWQKTPA